MKPCLHNTKRKRLLLCKDTFMPVRSRASRFVAVAIAPVALAMLSIPSARAQARPTDAGNPVAAKRLPLRGPSFIPDGRFQGSTLAGWRAMGQADWRAENGEIIGKGTGAGGWLVLDHSYQDAGLYTSFQCTGLCDTGVLLRLHQAAGGMQGTYLSIQGGGKDGEIGAYSLTLDAQGKEIERKKLRPAGGQIRFAPPPPDPSAPARAVPFRELPSAPPGVTIPITRPQQGIREGQWNEIEILLDADIIRAFVNDGGGQASAATEDMDSYGPIALYVGKGSEVRFKDIAYKDLAIKKEPREEVGSRFHMQRVSPFYYGWSAAAADFNHDGKMDIVSGPFHLLWPRFSYFQRDLSRAGLQRFDSVLHE